MKKSVTTLTAVAAACTMIIAAAPMASADSAEAVTSIRSFPKVTEVRKDLFAEAVSTEVDQDADWGGIESLNVPQTKSQTEKDAEAAAQAAAEAERAAQQQTAAASRSQSRESLTTTTTTTPSPSGTGGAAVAQYALQFRGYPYVYGGNTPAGWDCSGFVQYVFSQFGISLPRTSGAMMSAGSPVGSLAEAQPGDIITSPSHAAIYIGNGMVMNAIGVGAGTDTSAVSWAFAGGGYAIRRVI